MTVDVFDVVDFQNALQGALDPHNLSCGSDGLMGDEYHFYVVVREVGPHSIHIKVNSSVLASTGYAAQSGDNSIRAWLTDQNGEPLGSKTQRWVTRKPGWQKRLGDMIVKFIAMAQCIGYCSVCDSLECVYIVRNPNSVNKGRLFKKCSCPDNFTWLNGDEEVADVIPSCPKCTNRMIKRSGRFGEFWGCSTYPTCKGTLQIGQEQQTVADRQDNSYKLNDRVNLFTQTAIDLNEKVVVLPKRFVPSDYQQAIFNYVDDWFNGGDTTSNTLVINALAGSGKTTTGKHLMKRIPKNVKGLCVAYNRHIAKELQRVMPINVKTTTAHSLGFAACRNGLNLGNEPVQPTKVRTILENYMNVRSNRPLVAPITKLVGLVKSTLSDVQDADLDRLSVFYGIDLNGDSQFIFDAVRYVVKRATEVTSIIDYDDMVWLPVIMGLACEKYDFIFIDESQDLNACDLELIVQHTHENTKFVFVGDRYQSMYGFRGADVRSMENIVERFDAHELPLSITYRNPKNVVNLVDQQYPEIGLVAADWAVDGSVEGVSENIAISTMRDGDMVLCRINAPLVKPCFQLIRDGVKATIRGRDIGKGLINLIRKMKANDVNQLLALLNDYHTKEYAKLIEVNKQSQADSLSDKIETIYALADGLSTEMISIIESKIESIFSDDVSGVVFSSVHKAKGLEADNVFILKPELMPHPRAQQDWQIQQERNIHYVALTRCRQTLTFVV